MEPITKNGSSVLRCGLYWSMASRASSKTPLSIELFYSIGLVVNGQVRVIRCESIGDKGGRPCLKIFQMDSAYEVGIVGVERFIQVVSLGQASGPFKEQRTHGSVT